MSAKFPRIAHLPFSPGATPDDERMENLTLLLGSPVVLMEKMDGANVCLTNDTVYARSHSGPAKGRMFDELKAYHATIRHLIPPGCSVFAEWCAAVHSIEYFSEHFPRLFIIGARDDEHNTWTDWHHLYGWAGMLGCQVVPLNRIGVFQSVDDLRKAVEYHASERSSWGPRCEGVVVRIEQAFDDKFFPEVVAKYVNKGFKAGDALDGDKLQWQPGRIRR